MKKILTLLSLLVATSAWAQVPSASSANPLLHIYLNTDEKTLNWRGLTNDDWQTIHGELAPRGDGYRTNVCWGDSLTWGVGGDWFKGTFLGYPGELHFDTGDTYINMGIPGITSSQILTNFQAHPELAGYDSIIWDGRNDGPAWSGYVNQVTNNIAQLVAGLQTTNFVVLSVIVGTNEMTGTPENQHILDLNAALKTVYSNRFVDVLGPLIAYDRANFPADADYWSAGTFGPALRTTADYLHLNQTGYNIVAGEIMKSRFFNHRALTAISGKTVIASMIQNTPQDFRLDNRGTSTFTAGNDNFSAAAGIANIGVGKENFFANISGTIDIGMGQQCFRNNTSGYNNIGMGNQAGYLNTSGFGNIFAGNQAGYYNQTAHDNIAIGYRPLYSNSSGSLNVALGYQALYKNNGGYYNLAIGYGTLYNMTYGGANVALGFGAGYTTTGGNGSILIGANSCSPWPADNGTINIGSLIFGAGAYSSTTSGASSSGPTPGGWIGINTTNKMGTFTVGGDSYVLGNQWTTGIVLRASSGPVWSDISNTTDNVLWTSNNITFASHFDSSHNRVDLQLGSGTSGALDSASLLAYMTTNRSAVLASLGVTLTNYDGTTTVFTNPVTFAGGLNVIGGGGTNIMGTTIFTNHVYDMNGVEIVGGGTVVTNTSGGGTTTNTTSGGTTNTAAFLAYWPLDGTPWADATGNGNDLTATPGAVGTVAGLLNNAADIERSPSAYLLAGSQVASDTSFTVGAWINMYATNRTGCIVGQVNGGANTTPGSWMLEFISPNYIKFAIFAAGSGQSVSSSTTQITGTGQWHFVAGRYDTNSNTISVVLDNKVVTTAKTKTLGTSQPALSIGESSDNSVNYYLQGWVDEAWIYNGALTDDQLTNTLYNAGTPVAYPTNL